MGLAWACTRATAAAAVLRVSSPQVAALRESPTCPTDSAWGTYIVDSEHEWRAHDRACEPQLRLERESVGRVARTRQVVALKSSSRLVLARA